MGMTASCDIKKKIEFGVRPVMLLLATWWGFLIASGLCAQGKELQKLEVADHLDRRWTNELVLFDLDEATPRAEERYEFLGPDDNPMPFQFVRQANFGQVAFQVNLEPGESKVFRLFESDSSRPYETDIRIVEHDARIRLQNDLTGVAVATGEGQYRSGPIDAIRLRSGKWVGGSRLRTGRKVTGYSARIVERGPVFADLECRYQFENDRVWSIRFRLMSQEPIILVRERFDLDAEEAGFSINLSRHFEPDYMLYRESGINGRRQRKDSLDDSSEKPLFVLEPWVHWWRGRQRGLWLALGKENQPNLLYIASRNGSGWIDPESGANAGVGRLVTRDGQLEMAFGLTRKARYWMIGSLPAEGAYPEEKEARLRATPPQKWHIKYTTARLDKVKDWHLDWKQTETEFPHLYLTREDLEDFRRRARQSDYWKPKIDKPATAPGMRLRQIHWSLVKKDDPSIGWNYARSHGKKDEYITYYLLTGDENYARGIAWGAGQAVEGILNRYLVKPGLFTTPGNDPPRTSRAATGAANLVDLALGTDQLTPEQRRDLLSKLAFVAYQLADPDNYSPERRFSANPNMTSMMRSTLGVYACLLEGHPRSEEWAQAAIEEYEKELTNWIGPRGAWLENPHYQFASIPGIFAGSLALRNAGIRDFFREGQLRKTMTYSAQQVTPPDPRYGNARLLPPIGDGPGGARLVVYGWFANLYSDIDPAFSRTMQWVWQEMNYSLRGGFPSLGFYKEVLADRNLPARIPEWSSELFPYFGVVLRSSFPGDLENYLIMHQGRFHAHYGNDRGSVHVYAKGAPLALDFGPQYKPRVAQAFMHNKVSIAHADGDAGGEITEFSNLPALDYVRTRTSIHGRGKPKMPPGLTLDGWPAPVRKGHVKWQRQILMVKDEDPRGPHYFVFQDNVRAVGNGPTQWTMWNLSQKIGTPQQAGHLDAFLQDAPGEKIVPEARQLPEGNRYTAIGQHGVDTEYYIASPTETPRHTLRWGFKLGHGYSGIPEGIEEWQDVLHLQLPGTGHYYVVMYPRLRDQEAPEFQTLGEGRIIRLEGAFGTDHVFLAPEKVEARAGKVAFQGTAGLVQDREDGLTLALGAAGRATSGEYALASDVAATLHASPGRLTVKLGSAGQQCTVRLAAPGNWRVVRPQKATLRADNEHLLLTVPAGTERVELARK
jgi:hypothetical protein